MSTDDRAAEDTETTPQKGVSLARPLVYLGVAAAIGLGSLLLPSTGSARQAAPALGHRADQRPGRGVLRCQESLRPAGPAPAARRDARGLDDGEDRRARTADRGRRPGQVPRRLPQPDHRPAGGLGHRHRPQIATAIFGDPDRVQYVVLDIADRAGAVDRQPGGPRRQQLLGHLRPAARRGVLHGLHGGDSPDPGAGQLRCERGRGPRGEARVHLGGLHHGAHAAGAARPAGRADAAGHPGLHGRAAARPGRGRVQRRRAARGPGGAGSADPRRRAVAAAVVLRGRHAARRPGPRALRQRRARAGPQRTAASPPATSAGWAGWTPCPSPRPPATATERRPARSAPSKRRS